MVLTHTIAVVFFILDTGRDQSGEVTLGSLPAARSEAVHRLAVTRCSGYLGNSSFVWQLSLTRRTTCMAQHGMVRFTQDKLYTGE